MFRSSASLRLTNTKVNMKRFVTDRLFSLGHLDSLFCFVLQFRVLGLAGIGTAKSLQTALRDKLDGHGLSHLCLKMNALPSGHYEFVVEGEDEIEVAKAKGLLSNLTVMSLKPENGNTSRRDLN